MRRRVSSRSANSPRVSSLRPRRVIRVSESSRARAEAPPSWPCARASSSSVMPSCGEAAELGEHELGDRADPLRRAAGVQADEAGIREARGEGVDRVGEAALLADLLEQPRRHPAAEHRVEHAEHGAPLVGGRDPGDPHQQVRLLDRPAGDVQRAAAFDQVGGRVAAGHRIGVAAPSSQPAVSRARVTQPTSSSWSTAPATVMTRSRGP